MDQIEKRGGDKLTGTPHRLNVKYEGKKTRKTEVFGLSSSKDGIARRKKQKTSKRAGWDKNQEGQRDDRKVT